MPDVRALRTAPVRVRVPATSANLGPGFDTLGLALGLHDEIEARAVTGPTRVVAAGEGSGTVPTDGSHLVARVALETLAAAGAPPTGLELACTNRIPHARGLGSSSAAIVAGILVARGLLPDGDTLLPAAEVLRRAAAYEGHPDNVAPCVYGGFTVSWTGPDGAHAVRLEPAADLRPVAFVPVGQGLTSAARAVLPATVPHADAAATAARAALLVHALTAAPRLLLTATEDRLHQRYRAATMPASLELVDRLRAGGVPAVLSGAGPTVLALVCAGQGGASGPEYDTAGERADGFETLPLAVERAGATVLY